MKKIKEIVGDYVIHIDSSSAFYVGMATRDDAAALIVRLREADIFCWLGPITTHHYFVDGRRPSDLSELELVEKIIEATSDEPALAVNKSRKPTK